MEVLFGGPGGRLAYPGGGPLCSSSSGLPLPSPRKPLPRDS